MNTKRSLAADIVTLPLIVKLPVLALALWAVGTFCHRCVNMESPDMRTYLNEQIARQAAETRAAQKAMGTTQTRPAVEYGTSHPSSPSNK